MKIGPKPYLLLLFRLAVGAVFIFSGWIKLTAPVEEFRAAILRYQFFPEPAASVIAVMMPWAELIFGTFLFLGFMIKLSARMLALFLAGFIFLLLRSFFVHIDLTGCGCFGSYISLSPSEALLLDTGLFLMAFLAGRTGNLFLSFDAYLTKGSFLCSD